MHPCGFCQEGTASTLAHDDSNSTPRTRRHLTSPFRFAFSLTFLLSWSALVAWPLEPTTPLAEYGRQAWVMENGLPQNTVHALVQTRDGFLWLGTEAGLVRFDGNTFSVFDTTSSPALPSADIRCLLATDDGALWVGTSEGLVRWQDGSVKAFSTRNGLPGDSILELAQTQDGVLWVWTEMGLARLNGEGFTVVEERPSAVVTAVTAFGQSGSWVEATGSAGASLSGPWVQAVAQAGLPKEQVEFLAVLPGAETVAATNSTLIVNRGSTILQRLTAGKELPGSRIQAVFRGSRRVSVDRHQRRAGSAGLPASCNCCRSPIHWRPLRF